MQPARDSTFEALPKEGKIRCGRGVPADECLQYLCQAAYVTILHLSDRKIDLRMQRAHGVIKAPLVYVAHNPNNAGGGTPIRLRKIIVQIEILTHRIPICEVLAGQTLVDDHNRRRMFVIVSGEKTTLLQ